MPLNLQELLAMVGRSIADPRGGAKELMALNLPRTILWPGLILVVLLSTLVSSSLSLLSPPTGPFASMMASPFISAMITFSALALMVFGLHWVGRMFRGKGRLEDMILMITWWQAVLLVAQLGLLALALILTPVAALMFFAVLGMAIWMLVAFVDSVHGFDNLLKTLGIIVFALFAIGVGLSIVLSLIGISAEGLIQAEGMSNNV